MCKSCTFGSVISTGITWAEWSFCRFYGSVDGFLLLLFFFFLSFSISLISRSTALLSVCILSAQSNKQTKEKKKIYKFLLFSLLFFMCILMNFICLRRASISMMIFFFFLFLLNGMLVRNCYMNDAPAN